MPISTRYRCNNCGHRFVVDVLTREESREAERRNQRVYAITCPACGRQDMRRGWE